MSRAPGKIASVDDLFRLDPLARFEALMAGPNFAPYLRAEPIRFEANDPIYGTSCRVPGCAMHSTQAEWWCTRHSQDRRDVARRGVGEAEWLAGAVPFAPRPAEGRMPACRFCPDRDGIGPRQLCVKHEARHWQACRHEVGSSEEGWAARQVALPGAGDCRVEDCPRRAESEPSLCRRHRNTWQRSGQPDGVDMEVWLRRRYAKASPRAMSLDGLNPLVAAEIRYALWTHSKNAAPARRHPMWLRTLVKSCRASGVSSLLDIDSRDETWTTNPAAVNRIVREMLKDVRPLHQTRADTRELGFLDTNYWGFRFPDRRSAFDLTAISQRWLRDLTWDFLADQLDSPGHPRTQGPFEQVRRSIVCFSAYLSDCDPFRGAVASALSAATAKEFAADLRGCVSNAQPVRGVFDVKGRPSIATATTYSLSMNALGDSYVLIAGSQVEPFLQQVWVTGPGNAQPGQVVLTPSDAERTSAEKLMVDLAAVPIEHGLCTYKPVVGGFDCPFGRNCNSCEHFVITGADYGYWKRQEERWAAMAEGSPDETARNYIYGTFERSSRALAGLEKALVALGLLDQAKELDLRSPHQDFFNPVWTQGWRAGDLVELGGREQPADGPRRSLEDPDDNEARAAS